MLMTPTCIVVVKQLMKFKPNYLMICVLFISGGKQIVLVLTSQKTACMLVSTSQKQSHVHSYGLDVNVFDVQIPVCKSHKVLGIVINETLDWTAQINDVVAKRINYSLFSQKDFKNHIFR